MNTVRETSSHESRSLADLFGDLTQESTTLVRKEFELARAEIAERTAQLQSGVVSLVIGAAIMIAGLFYILDAIVFGLGEVLPPDLSPWLAALIVGLVVGGIGYALVKSGQDKLKPRNFTLHHTTNSLKKDTRMVKEHIQ